MAVLANVLENAPDDVAMFECFDERHFLLDVLVLSLCFRHVFDVQLNHLHCDQLAGVRQATPNLPNTVARP